MRNYIISMLKYFKTYGLTCESEIDCLLVEEGKAPPDVKIQRGRVGLAGKHKTWDRVDYAHISDDELIVCWKHIGTILVESGSLITIDTLADCSEETVRLPLLGTVMSIILWQRGLTVLHGSSVRMGEDAVMFLGQKGQGKSTLGGWCNKNGYPYITDDVCALELERDTFLIRPSFPQVKLSPEVLEFLDEDPDDYLQVHPMVDKRLVDLAGFCEDKQIISGICVLESGDELRLERLDGMVAMQEILRHMMLNRFAEGQTESLRKMVFLQASKLVKTVPVYRLVRPRDLELLPKTLKLLEELFFSEVL